MPFTRMRYHIVFSTKGRRPWVTSEIEKFLYPVMGRIAKDMDGHLLQIGGIEDHVHLLSAIPPSIAVSDFVGGLKSNSSGAIKRHFPWMNQFQWQEEFSGFTIGPNDLPRISRYIQNQKEHHKQDNLIMRFESRSE